VQYYGYKVITRMGERGKK